MITITACGRVREKWMREGIEEYAKRIRAYDKLNFIEVQDEKTPDGAGEAIEQKIKENAVIGKTAFSTFSRLISSHAPRA